MTAETLFDEAWERWRREVTAAIADTFGDDAGRVLQVLADVGALDPDDHLIAREWALSLLTKEAERVGRLLARGLSEREIRELAKLIEQHPLPAAGG